MPVRYISDLHLYDLYCWEWRTQFSQSFKLFNSYLISHWNDVVDDKTVVIIAGDVGNCCQATFDVLHQLNGIKILVVGNHDVPWGDNIYRSDLFAGTHQFIENNGIYVQHFPEFDDDARKNNNYLIHGHHHGYETYNMIRARQQYLLDSCRYNCAADIVNYTPRTLQELILIKEKLIYKYADAI